MANIHQEESSTAKDTNVSLHETPCTITIKLYVKNMVTVRCKMLVESVLEVEKIPYLSVAQGEIEFAEHPATEDFNTLKECLDYYGMPLLDNHKLILVERIKTVVIDMVHAIQQLPGIKYSVYISKKLNHNYTYLANLFSEIKGMTLERFIILHKIEKVKQLILYGELNLSEIAHKLKYSSAAHLSSQFKQITGSSPSRFKKEKEKKQILLEDL